MDVDVLFDDREIESGSEIDGMEDKERPGQETKKAQQSKATVSAKILNDFEQRRLEFKLTHLEKEFLSKTQNLTSKQKELKRELVVINPDRKRTQKRGLIIPRGLTKDEADKYRISQQETVSRSGLSISLKDYDAARRQKVMEARAVREQTVTISDEEIKRRINKRIMKGARGRRGGIQLDKRPELNGRR